MGELEDQLYEMGQDLQDAQDKASELEAENAKLKAAGGARSPEVKMLQMELEDMRDAKERAQQMLARATGG